MLPKILGKLFGSDSSKSNTPKILIADDEKHIRSLVSMHLADLEVQVEEAQDVKSALALLQKKTRYHLFIIDLHMPGDSGLKLVNEIRKNKASANTPILILTGAAPESSLEQIREEVRNLHYMTKPFDGKKLCAFVQEQVFQGKT